MELFRALAVLIEDPQAAEAARVSEALMLGPLPTAAEYTELFGFQLCPYASIYLGPEGMLGGQARAAVAGFWQALGLVAPVEPDHLAVMLAMYARLAELENGESDPARRGGWGRARRAFLWEHLLSWLPVYLTKLSDLAPPFYRRWGEILEAALGEEAKAAGGRQPVPVYLREAPGLIDPRKEEAGKFLASLLSPVRSGMVLTRADLGRAARKLGLGLRLGARKFMLAALFSQDAAGMFDWLIAEAFAWTERHRAHKKGAFKEIATAWEQQAKAATVLLSSLRHELIASAGKSQPA
jgi:TorA maturation chaperone TorD